MAIANKILVIKLGALGDFLQALGPMKAIRDHHPDAQMALLTTAPYVELARKTGLFDSVFGHDRMKWHHISRIYRLRSELRASQYRRVYDMQTSDRSSLYFRLFWPGPYPEWSGIATGCSHPHSNPERDHMHTIERQAEQLALAGIPHVPSPELSWANADVGHLVPRKPYVVLVPGGAPHRPDKRWPVENYGGLAREISSSGRTPILIGAQTEYNLHNQIIDISPGTHSLAGKTTLVELASLMRNAEFAVGNDTGPMHMAAISGIPSVVLYSHASDPKLCAQRGPEVTILRESTLADISVRNVEAVLSSLLASDA